MSVSFLSWLRVGPVPLFWTCSHLSWGWGQVSSQSADAQEQVEGLLAENNALRTSLAALEQVQDTWEPLLISPCCLYLSCFWSTSGQGDLDPLPFCGLCFCSSFLLASSLLLHLLLLFWHSSFSMIKCMKCNNHKCTLSKSSVSIHVPL